MRSLVRSSTSSASRFFRLFNASCSRCTAAVSGAPCNSSWRPAAFRCLALSASLLVSSPSMGPRIDSSSLVNLLSGAERRPSRFERRFVRAARLSSFESNISLRSISSRLSSENPISASPSASSLTACNLSNESATADEALACFFFNFFLLFEPSSAFEAKKAPYFSSSSLLKARSSSISSSNSAGICGLDRSSSPFFCSRTCFFERLFLGAFPKPLVGPFRLTIR
mmetsp:Transcript_71879/g.83541  ORF Transcript_71879/g.83541 Transcript_71879/m.83541 type:complete len:226 (-) Transcript_71879:42-719(-)